MSAALLFAIAGTGETYGPATPPHQERDDVWIAAIRQGNEQAFEALFRAYVQSLLRFANSYTHDDAIAHEIVDDVFIAVWQRHETWSPTEGAAAYLFASVRHRALNALRNERRREQRDIVAATSASQTIQLVAQEDGALAGELTDDETQVIDTLLAALPEQRRRVMVLRWQHEMSPDEIAVVLGMSRNAVYLALSRSLELLRRLFGASVTSSAEPTDPS
jgi:RNA polymerase sigma-70 factor (ECF subfamily)